MELKKTTAYLWGQAYKVTPYLVEQTWGDGKQFIALSPMLIRPNYYVVRIDSKMDTYGDDFRDMLDEIYEAIDEEFGPCCENYGSCECDHWKTWPATFDWGGCSWGSLGERTLIKLGLIKPRKKRRQPQKTAAAVTGAASFLTEQSKSKEMIAVLFARKDSIYKSLPDCDVWDLERDARNWQGGCPIIAHPPCRAWGRLRAFAKPREGERELATWAVEQVRKWGGVLEHPANSLLWPEVGLPKPGERDSFGGWSIWISQWWFGHRADKPTLLYVVGCEPGDLPGIPFKIGEPTHVIQSRKRNGYRPHVSKAEREHTPPALAEWLCEIARRIHYKPFQL